MKQEKQQIFSTYRVENIEINKEEDFIFLDAFGNKYAVPKKTDKMILDMFYDALFEYPREFETIAQKEFFHNLFMFPDNLNRSYKFIIMYLEQEEIQREIQRLIIDSLENAVGLKLQNRYIIFFPTKQVVSIRDFVDTIGDDFGVKLSIFESPATSKNGFFELFSLVREYLLITEYGYYALKDLILNIYQKNSQVLRDLRNLVEEEFVTTSHFEEFIPALFKNNLNVSKTAKEVYMHRNTINNRLEAIQNITTLNLQTFQDAMAMYILFTAK